MLNDARSAAGTIAVSVLTGFLGSGKTTLLNHLLQHPDIDETAVLINEFGDVALDHLLVDELSDDILLLSSGCICCTVQGELVDSLKNLYMRRLAGQVPDFKRVIIETTGLADPIPIITCLMKDPLFKHTYRLESLVTTVDGVHGSQQLDRHPEAIKQAAVADRIIITKIDLASEGAVTALKQRLAELNPGALVIPASHGRVGPDQLFDVALYDPKSKTLDVQRWLNEEAYIPERKHDHEDEHGDHAHQHPVDVNRHDDQITAFCIYLDRPIAWQPFLDWFDDLANEKGDHLLRIKGIINVVGEDAPYAIHCVQATRHTPTRLPAWPHSDQRSRIVFITHDLPQSEIEASLASAGLTSPAQEAASRGRPLEEVHGAGGVRDTQSTKSVRWLNDGEITRIFGALLNRPDHPAADVIRLMLLTGARVSEALEAHWDQFDLKAGIWMKPSPESFSKQPRRVRLPVPARLFLQGLRRRSGESPLLFSPMATANGLSQLRDFWAEVGEAAGLESVDLEALRPTLGSQVFAGLEPVVLDRLLGLASAVPEETGSSL